MKIRLTGSGTCSSCEPYLGMLCRDQVEDEKAFPRENSDFINGEELVVKGEYIHVSVLWRMLRVYSHREKTKASLLQKFTRILSMNMSEQFRFRIGMKSLSFPFTLGVNGPLRLLTCKKNSDIIS